MASCVSIMNRCVAAKHLLQFSKAKPRCTSLVCSASSPTCHSPRPQKHQVPPRHRPGGLQPRLGTAGASPQGTCHLHLACRNAHPEHLSPATSCNKGSLRTPWSLHGQTPPFAIPLFNLNDRFNTQRQKSLQSSSNPKLVHSHKQELSSTFGACLLYVLTIKGKRKIGNALKNKRRLRKKSHPTTKYHSQTLS